MQEYSEARRYTLKQFCDLKGFLSDKIEDQRLFVGSLGLAIVMKTDEETVIIKDDEPGTRIRIGDSAVLGHLLKSFMLGIVTKYACLRHEAGRHGNYGRKYNQFAQNLDPYPTRRFPYKYLHSLDKRVATWVLDKDTGSTKGIRHTRIYNIM